MLSYIAVDPQQLHHKAGWSTITAVISAGIARIADVHVMIQDIAGLVAIGSGCMAIAYYYVSILEKIRNRRKDK
jgi:hypothetical protein